MFGRYPTATVTVEELGQLPQVFTLGEVTQRKVDAMINVKGDDRPVSFDVKVRLDAGALNILGRTSFTWQELGMSAPNIANRIKVEDRVKVEILIVATPSLESGG